MGKVTLNDIKLSKYTLENDLPLLNKLKNDILATKPEICIERARYITKYLKDMSSDNHPREIRYAKAVNYYLTNKEPIFFDDNLLAGTTTSKKFGAPVYPEFGTGLSIWPELDTISKRTHNPLKITEQEADELNFKIYPYWMERSIMEYTRKKYNNPDCMKLFHRLVFYISGKAGCISHTVPYFNEALEKGLEYIINEAAKKEKALKDEPYHSSKMKETMTFYNAVQISLKGIIAYAQKLSKKAAKLAAVEQDSFRKKNLEKMSEICAWIPAKPARTFREAINAIWIIHIAILAENINMAMSPGRLDQILYKYYENDIKNGILTVKDTMELVGCLWLKLNDNTNLVPEASEILFGGAGTVPAVTLGGVDENNEDAVNDLTYIMLRVTELLKTRDPNVNARYNYTKNSLQYRNRVIEIIANTKAIPAIHNDITDIATLVRQGVKPEDARDYAIIGCVELASAGKSYDASSSIILNLASALELTLFNGKRPKTGDEQISPPTGDPANFQNFDEFWEAFTTQLKWVIKNAIQLNEYFGKVHQEIQPSPLLSAFFKGPMDKGKDLIYGGALYNSSGATHIGFADTVDSITAIEHAIFKEKKYTFPMLIEAIKANFIGYEEMHAYLVNKTPKFGMVDEYYPDYDISVKNSQNLVIFLYQLYQSHMSYRNGSYRPAYWTMTNHTGQGQMCGALPNGRRDGRSFASGITPVSQEATSLAQCFSAVSKLDHLKIPGGMALNLKHPIIKEEDINLYGDVIESYFKTGGMHVQFNIMSYKMLLDALENKSDPNFIVRVSGYSAYFKDLNEAMKEEIITRSEYDIETATLCKFPKEYDHMIPFNLPKKNS